MMADCSSTERQPPAKHKGDGRVQDIAIFSWSDCARRWTGDCNYLVSIGGDIFMRGGEQVFQYMHTQDQWRALRFARRLYCGMCVWDGKLALVGGKEGQSVLAGSRTIYRAIKDTLVGTVVVYDQERWAAMEAPVMPFPCMWPAVVVDQRRLLVIGGMDAEGRPLGRVQVYDGSTREWLCVQQLPRACSNASCTIWDNAVYLAGGDGLDTDVYCANLNELYESKEVQTNSLPLALANGVWKKLPSLQSAFSSLCIIDGVIVAAGGTAGLTKTSSVYGLSMITVTWKSLGDLSTPCVCLVVALPNSELVCMERGAGPLVFKGRAVGLNARLQQMDGTWPLPRQRDLPEDWIGVSVSHKHVHV